MYLSDKPAYVFKADVAGFYKTIGVAFSPLTGDDFEDIIAKKGISEDFRKMVPALATYITQRAQNVEEALEVLNSINIYTYAGTSAIPWNFSYMMTDADGNNGVCEIVDNKIIWNDTEHIQTNFYLSKGYRDAQYKTGKGRYACLENGMEGCKTDDDLYKLICKVEYSQVFANPRTSCFDVRNEFLDHGKGWTTAYVEDPNNQEEVWSYIDNLSNTFNAMTLEKKVAKTKYWNSAFTIVANCTQKTLFVRFFEEHDNVLNLSFD